MPTEIERRNVKLVKAAMDGILVRHDHESVDRHFHPAFVQHNPWAKDGSAHVREMCAFEFGLVAKRWSAQGDRVAYHGLYTAPNPLGDNPLLCVDIWRVQDGQIVEHWDALQPMPAETAETMIAGEGDGLSDLPLGVVASHVARARRLLEVGVNQNDDGAIDAILAPSFRVHLPDVPDAIAGLKAWRTRTAPRLEIYQTVASGDLVFVHALMTTERGRQVTFDVFRFDGHGRITDQWIVAQDVVAPGQAANPHPHF